MYSFYPQSDASASESKGDDDRPENALVPEEKWTGALTPVDGDVVEKELLYPTTPTIIAMKSSQCNTAPRSFKIYAKDEGTVIQNTWKIE